MDWRVQVLGKKCCEVLPMGDKLHTYIQSRLGKLGNLDKEKQLRNRVVPTLKEISNKSGKNIEGMQICELGTGWYALTPVVFYALGANEIHTHDIVKWLTASELQESIKTVDDNIDYISNEFDRNEGDIADRINNIKRTGDTEQILESCNTFYHLGGTDIHEPTEKFDLYYSYSVLHRIPESDLHTFLTKSSTFGKSNALSYHVVEHIDILSRHDEGRNPYGFLQYSDSRFNLIQTKYSYQNRLRHSDLIHLFKKYDFQPIYIKRVDGDPELLSDIELADKFSGYKKDDLTVRRTRLLSERGADSENPIIETE
ncbi:hypothetical protein [Halomicrobium sp. LC1Hm]|uniref:hypothetical protein n=1 Tax=Halomicrobium sp. LC1Hm TaxID=2610902 RepID=UPI001298303E|nr:hypothetical protein [Halomicrobium sp. LC1Hm]QGA83742.1 hypothetical protein LC1Hm_2709 [Halomicrobium sp. LC1Hm]